MPKLKTHRGLAKRVKVTKNGKVKRSQAWKKHLNTGKKRSRKRRLRSSVIVGCKGEQKRLLRLLGLR